jgi:beta-lactamase regulating signal transducer with metallopeptidase domain
MMNFAQLAVERVLNSLPEGLLIAFSAWLLLRIMGRQNSGTRFAVWLIALAGVVAMPVLGGLGFGYQALPAAIAHARPEIAVSAFWAVAFFVFWIALAALALARVITGVWEVRQIRRSCAEVSVSDVDPSLQDLLAASARPVRLLVSDKARVPAALGFRNPAVVLPSWMLHDLTSAELRPILIHELAHLRRHDDWTNLLQKTIRAVLFFHPAVWWIDARLSLEREMACDDAVVAATGNARAYAGCLIDLLEKAGARRSLAMAQAAVARARDASVRIARILRVGPAATTRVGRAAIGVAASLSLACAGVALFTPRLVEFVPMETTSTAQVTKPLVDGAVRFPAAVVPASFHPAEHPVAIRKKVTKRNPPSRTLPVRQLATLRTQPAKAPVVLASLTTSDPAKPAIDAASQTQAEPVPMLIVFETRESANGVSNSAQLRTVDVQPGTTLAQQFQSREDPGLQIQMFEAIDPVTGTPIRIVRIVVVMPQIASPSQTI